jgi:hypothetical protein
VSRHTGSEGPRGTGGVWHDGIDYAALAFSEISHLKNPESQYGHFNAVVEADVSHGCELILSV